METTSKQQDNRENPSPNTSPNSNGSTTSMSSSTTNNNNGGGCGGGGGGGVQQHLHQTQTPPLTPKPISRSDHHQTNPYPTTFVQANTSTFKQVVQMLTGSSETAKQASSPPSPSPSPSSRPNQDFNIPNKSSIPPIKTAQKKQQQQPGFKLYERRNQQRNKLIINPLINHGGRILNSAAGAGNFSPRYHEILSPSLLDFPNKLVLSPVTPLNDDPFHHNSSNSSSNKSSSSSEEDKAIAERGFYLHPSPVSTPRECEPQLLPLFPVTSPRVSRSSS